MKPLDIYFQYPIELVWGKGIELKDAEGNKYIDFYGGHGVISIGHSHSEFVKAITSQLDKIAFYSNAFLNGLQSELSERLGQLSGYEDYNLFLSNSGAEANENAIKVASFTTGRSKMLAIKGAFHGRSAGAVGLTDNPKIRPSFGSCIEVDFIDFNDLDSLIHKLQTKEYAAFFIEGIQGVGGVWEGSVDFWQKARELCTETGTVLVADEVQSGYGRSGKFFAHQYHEVKADIITTGKGMGNGFPIAGTLINPELKLEKGMLGTTFGGGHLACAAGISVLKVIEQDNLVQNAKEAGQYIVEELSKIDGVKAVRGRGLMTGIEFNTDAKALRKKLMDEYGYITGFSNPDILRILPPLNITKEDAKKFIEAVKSVC